MSIQKFLDLSTGHLPVSDRERLDQLKNRDLPFRVFSHEYGWNIWLNGSGAQFNMNIVSLSEVYGFSNALGNILRHAFVLGCWMINLDRDAERIDGLAYWDE